MKILEILKNIGIHVPKLKEITGIKFSSLIHIDRSIHVEGLTVVINANKLKGKQKRALKQIMPDLLNESGAILDESSAPTVDAVVKSLPAIQGAAKGLAQIIPPTDVPLLNACLFLRMKYQRGEAVEVLKAQIMRIYGTRGGNFANLCSAGYLESTFLPAYEELTRAYPNNPEEAKAKYQTFYKTVLNELPWTEFVSGRAPAAKTTVHIVEKMKRNVLNGVRYLNIHALGEKNVKTVASILPSIQEQTGANIVKLEKEKSRIFVRFEIPPKSSSSN